MGLFLGFDLTRRIYSDSFMRTHSCKRMADKEINLRIYVYFVLICMSTYDRFAAIQLTPSRLPSSTSFYPSAMGNAGTRSKTGDRLTHFR